MLRIRSGEYLSSQSPQNLTVATTGASGSLFLKHFLLAVEADKRIETVNFIASDSALRVMAEELGLKGRSDLVGQLLGKDAKPSRKIQQQSNTDIGANVASGSYPADAMVVIPCSVGTLARIANGIASQLIERAADVSLKENRPCSLCARDASQQNSHPQHVPCRRRRRDRLPADSRLLQSSGQRGRNGPRICQPRSGPSRLATA
jgi:4-hydroxy-3-polyprenylbenzoate decarboxylase